LLLHRRAAQYGNHELVGDSLAKAPEVNEAVDQGIFGKLPEV
jgi:hypothetical protein